MNFYEHEPVSLYLDGLTQIEEIQSPYQHIQMMNHPWLGKILVINGEIQHIEKYQALYHEMLIHLPAAFIPEVSSALVLGGGSLFAAYEILKYPSVKKVLLCDYDRCVLELMKKHYPHARAVLEDERFQYVESEGIDFITRENGFYDLVVNDCFNLASESKRIACSMFSLLSNRCTQMGVCVDIVYRHIFDKQITIDTLRCLQSQSHLVLSLVTVPEYPGILHLETIWTPHNNLLSQNLKAPINIFQQKIAVQHKASPFQYFSPQNLPFYLYLPPYIKEMFSL